MTWIQEDDPTMTEAEFRASAQAMLNENASRNPSEVRLFDINRAWQEYVRDPRPWHEQRDETMVMPPPLAMFTSSGPWWSKAVDDAEVPGIIARIKDPATSWVRDEDGTRRLDDRTYDEDGALSVDEESGCVVAWFAGYGHMVPVAPDGTVLN